RIDDTSADSAVTADIIRSQTVAIPISVAPCTGKIVRCSINATQWVEIGVAGTVTARFYKAVIGAANTAITSATTTISWVTADTELTADTVIDGTMTTTAGVTDVIEGQLIYCDIVASNHAIAAKSLGMLIMVEFVPTDVRD
ncbi:MAG: hypothetical protein Q8P98_11245, partial [Candidatus Rokubacteria bacterium]|nr:hypothetical protein [Candidatus Rokubacteria bacterium]